MMPKWVWFQHKSGCGPNLFTCAIPYAYKAAPISKVLHLLAAAVKIMQSQVAYQSLSCPQRIFSFLYTTINDVTTIHICRGVLCKLVVIGIEALGDPVYSCSQSNTCNVLASKVVSINYILYIIYTPGWKGQ